MRSSELFRNNRKNQLNDIKALFMNQGLRFRLAFSLTFISVVPLLALGIFTYYKSAATIQDIVSKYTNDITNEININIFLNFKVIDDISKILLNSDPIKEILSKEGKEATEDYKEDYLKVVSILKSIKFSNDYITSIYILSEKSNNIYAAGDVTGNYGLSFLTPEYIAGYKQDELYRETLAEYNNYKWWPPQNVLGQNVFVLTRKLYDVDRGNLGVIVVHVNQNILSNISDRLTNGKNTLIYLTDEKGTFIYHPETAYVGKKITDREITERVNQNESGSFVTQKGLPKLFVVYNTFFVTGWKLVALTPYRQLISEANTLRNVTLIIFLTCLGLVVFLSLFISRGILNPVHKLIQLMKQGSTGDMTVRFNVLYQDEIGELGVSFNRMMTDIKELMQKLETEEKQKIEAEITALEAHINPHFLYNTLASIYWMAMAEGNVKVAQMASSLSNFFRLGLNKGKEFTTIEKEVEHVGNYLRIQKMRFEEKFDYEIQVAKEIYSFRTIKLILQPLVENSLVHGVENIDWKGFIRIEGFQKETRVVFRVIDNGRGISNLSGDGFQEIVDQGYGLKNIRERLKLYFNNDFTMNCSSIPGKVTTFEITMPAVEHEGEKHV